MSEHQVLKAVGLAIRARRAELNVSQEELAAEAGVHRTYIGGVERGERNLGLINLVKIAYALRTSPAEILRSAESNFSRQARSRR